jgi:hypothetical protein
MTTTRGELTAAVTLAVILGLPAIARAVEPSQSPGPSQPPATVGCYYFDGWAGESRHADTADWARNAPTHLTQGLVEDFPEREPIWGWRDDSVEIMQQQIDLAADHGVDFFAFCWYYHTDEQAIRDDCKNGCIDRFLKAKNNNRMKFCLLVANHGGYLMPRTEDWQLAAKVWIPLMKHPRHLTVDGKPVVIIFNSNDDLTAGVAHLRVAARAAGLPGVTVVGCTGSRESGYDYWTRYAIKPPRSRPETDYADAVPVFPTIHDKPCIPLVTAGWDCRPWQGPRGLGNKPPGPYFTDRTPEKFAAHLRNAATWMDQHPQQTTKERLVLVYAWNEFGEGGYVAPTKGDPDGKYLDAIRSVAGP